MFLQQYFKHLFAAMVLVAAFVGCVQSAEAGIQRLDTCNQTFAPSQQVPAIRERAATIIVRGDFTDLASYTGNSLLNLQKGSTGNGGQLNTFATLHLTPSASIGGGVHTITVHYPVGGEETFQINLSTAKIDSFTISPNSRNVIQGSMVTITATGSGLNQGMRLSSSFASHFGALSTSSSATTFTVTGPVNSSVDLKSLSYGITALPDGCSGNALPGSADLNLTVGLPDLVPIVPVAYRLGPADSCGATVGGQRDTSANFTTLCNLVTAPTQANPHVEQQVDVGLVDWGVKNNSPFNITTGFTIQLKNGINVLQEHFVPALGANSEVHFKFNRTESHRTIVRDFNCPKCMDKNVAPLNWTDPVFTVAVNVNATVKESSTSNNSANSN